MFFVCLSEGDVNLDFSGARFKASLIAIGITILTVAYYYFNNAYDAVVATQGLVVNLLLYYIFVEPVYVIFIALFGWYIYQQDKELFSAFRGVIAGILITVALDLISLPHSIPSLFAVGQTIALPIDPNLAPYADYQIAKAMSNGEVSFITDIFIYILFPVILNIAALVIAKPTIYTEAFESAA